MSGGEYKPGANEAAAHLRVRMERIEEHVTADIRTVAGVAGGSTARLNTRLKEPDSIARKLLGTTASSRIELRDADSIDDALRYTVVLGDSDYAAGTLRVVAELRAIGYLVEEPSLTWRSEGYRGINLKVRSPGGERFEVQTQTPASLKASDDTHEWYEEKRRVTTPAKRRAELEQLINARYALVDPPPGIRLVG